MLRFKTRCDEFVIVVYGSSSLVFLQFLGASPSTPFYILGSGNGPNLSAPSLSLSCCKPSHLSHTCVPLLPAQAATLRPVSPCDTVTISQGSALLSSSIHSCMWTPRSVAVYLLTLLHCGALTLSTSPPAGGHLARLHQRVLLLPSHSTGPPRLFLLPVPLLPSIHRASKLHACECFLQQTGLAVIPLVRAGWRAPCPQHLYRRVQSHFQ